MVIADIAPMREITDNGTKGLLFPVGDRLALAECIRRYMDDQDLYRNMR